MSERFLAEVVVPGASSSVSLLRQYATLVLTAVGHRNLDAVLLVLSELLNNAVMHTRSGDPDGLVTVEISDIGGRLARIEVTDEGARTVLRPRQVGDDGDFGRGLQLVEALSARWGVRRSFPGYMVWAEVLTVEDSPPPAEPLSMEVVAA
ncbi:ATP-binding protein [Nonomuraea guangzhouensis]|uniref:ATP-binding protein n=1 Tax=Nonomuraea guangzhouensis TaxID=1291555 RepID=A0ABW4G6U4_9ACTN|nr:ATP-binding protein [Nonomuraea guangzhouensis]